MDARDEARRLLHDAQVLHGTGDIKGALRLAREALQADPDYVEALEHVANVLVTRLRNYAGGLVLIDRAVDLRPDDPGIWYARGWCYEFAAHELRRRPTDAVLDPRDLLETAATSFRRCLNLHPSGKLSDDATDLLDHVENELRAQ